ncbi:YdcF family protein [Gracilibacillus salinarum]|uniref:YdcF family protein n=1 Tax=Gracilibacillus salinarum TaxID=2932255 RepID=A0ABY4GQA0_9BACI|nr:YdcF family protein [Gracilibacillus salinarum]UOQ86419.1 YdcF family protein [Gracilibacillus salinarum]
MKKWLLIVFAAFFLFFLVHTSFIVIDGWTDEKKQTELGVVFGNKVNQDGSLSKRLKARLDKALQYYESKKVEKVLVSGGIGKEDFDEAKVMEQYLIRKGVNSADIIVDSNGYNTRMTAENSFRIAKANQLSVHRITVITQYFHVTRAKLAMKQAGFQATAGAHAEYVEWRDIYSIIREFPAFYQYWLFSD